MEKNRISLKFAKECGINCAAAAYQTLYYGTANLAYENTIALIDQAGGKVGIKNHSREFCRNFLLPCYRIIREKVKNYVIQNNTPFGIIADKMTTCHLTLQILGIRAPVWDFDVPYITKDIHPLLANKRS